MKHVKNKFCLFGSLRRVGILSLMLSLGLVTVFAQQLTVRGTVLDEDGESVIGVNIMEKGTNNGVVTDIDGNYSITVSNGQRSVLTFSFVGYNTKEETVSGRATINVSLDPSVVNLSEVVAIGYGTQTRREITGSVVNITEESFNRGLTRDAADLLQGRVAGLWIVSGSGDVTSRSNMRLRGTSTLQNDQGPFIVIDGIPGGSLSDIAPQDIEAISVLKDASSQAIYGSRAASGVILITTKRGSGMRTQVSYNGYLSADQIRTKPPLMNAEQWRAYAAANNRDTSPYDRYGVDNTDWFDEITRTGISQNHSLSLSGAGTRNNYRAAFTYQDRVGVLRDNDMQNMNFRFSFQQRAMQDKLRIGITANARISESLSPNTDNIILSYNMLPVYPVFNPDGSYFTTVNQEYDQGNPVQIQDLNEVRNKGLSFLVTGDIQYTIIEGLNLKANLTRSRSYRERLEFRHSETKPGSSSNGFAQKRIDYDERLLQEWTLDYDKAFNDVHKVQGIIGYSWDKSETSRTQAQNRNFLVNDLKWNRLEAGTGLMSGDASSYANSEKLISLFARAHYSFKERYMITATIRRDGSSKFGANHKWGTFPSASLAWGISDESFMQGISWLNDMKIRVGYGVTGNQAELNPYRSLEVFGTSGIYYDAGVWQQAYAISRNPNPDLRWESTGMFNVGIDFSLFNRRVSGTIEYYNKNTYDMLYTYAVPVPPFVQSTIQANVGDMRNRGIEFALNAQLVRNRTFRWDIGFNAAHNRNLITRLSNELYTTTRIYEGDPWIRGGSNITSHVLEEGYPVGQFFLLICDGIDEEGRYIIRDVNQDGRITEDDRDYAGVHEPWMVFGLNNSFSYNQWDASFFFRGSLGQKVLNNPRAAYATPAFLIGANAWDDPLTYQLNESPRMCSLYIEDGSFVKLDNLSIGYTVRLKSRDWIERLRFYVAGQDLLVLTRYKGLDPEVSINSRSGRAPGLEYRANLPRARTFTFGANITF